MSIAQSAETVNPLASGGIVPNGNLVSNSGEQTSLYKLIENKASVIVFYRGNW